MPHKMEFFKLEMAMRKRKMWRDFKKLVSLAHNCLDQFESWSIFLNTRSVDMA